MTDADLNIKRVSPFFGMNYWLEFTNGIPRCQGREAANGACPGWQWERTRTDAGTKVKPFGRGQKSIL